MAFTLQTKKDQKTMGIKIKASDLRRLVRESVQKQLSEQRRLAECADMQEEENKDELTMEEASKLVDQFVAEAFGETGDSNGAHVGGTFGDGGEEKGPIEEGKKKKGLPPALAKHMKKKKEEAPSKKSDKKEEKTPSKKK